MSKLWRAGVCVAILAFAVSTVQAQQRGGGGGGLHTLVGNKSVQDELKMTEDQKTKVADIVKTTTATVTDKTKDLTGDDRRTKLPAIMKEVNEATEKSLGGILKEDQTKRLKQIQLQQSGYRAFTQEGTQKTLKFTDEQTKEVKTMAEEATKKMMDETKDLQRNDPKRREISTKISKETMEKITEKLTADQKKAWKEMTGEPFEIKFERRPQQ